MANPIVIAFSLNPNDGDNTNRLLASPFGVTNQITIQGIGFDGSSSQFVLSGQGVSFSNFAVSNRTQNLIQGSFEAWGLLVPGTQVSVTVDVFNAYGANTHSFPFAFPAITFGEPPAAAAPTPVGPSPIVGPNATTPTPDPQSMELNGDPTNPLNLGPAPDGAQNSILVTGSGFIPGSQMYLLDSNNDVFPNQPIPTIVSPDGTSLSATFAAISAGLVKLPEDGDGSAQLTVCITNPIDGSGSVSGFLNSPVAID